MNDMPDRCAPRTSSCSSCRGGMPSQSTIRTPQKFDFGIFCFTLILVLQILSFETRPVSACANFALRPPFSATDSTFRLDNVVYGNVAYTSSQFSVISGQSLQFAYSKSGTNYRAASLYPASGASASATIGLSGSFEILLRATSYGAISSAASFCLLKQTPPVAPYTWGNYDVMTMEFYPDGRFYLLTAHLNSFARITNKRWQSTALPLNTQVKIRADINSTSVSIWTDDVFQFTVTPPSKTYPTLPGLFKYDVEYNKFVDASGSNVVNTAPATWQLSSAVFTCGPPPALPPPPSTTPPPTTPTTTPPLTTAQPTTVTLSATQATTMTSSPVITSTTTTPAPSSSSTLSATPLDTSSSPIGTTTTTASTVTASQTTADLTTVLSTTPSSSSIDPSITSSTDPSTTILDGSPPTDPATTDASATGPTAAFSILPRETFPVTPPPDGCGVQGLPTGECIDGILMANGNHTIQNDATIDVTTCSCTGVQLNGSVYNLPTGEIILPMNMDRNVTAPLKVNGCVQFLGGNVTVKTNSTPQHGDSALLIDADCIDGEMMVNTNVEVPANVRSCMKVTGELQTRPKGAIRRGLMVLLSVGENTCNTSKKKTSLMKISLIAVGIAVIVVLVVGLVMYLLWRKKKLRALWRHEDSHTSAEPIASLTTLRWKKKKKNKQKEKPCKKEERRGGGNKDRKNVPSNQIRKFSVVPRDRVNSDVSLVDNAAPSPRIEAPVPASNALYTPPPNQIKSDIYTMHK